MFALTAIVPVIIQCTGYPKITEFNRFDARVYGRPKDGMMHTVYSAGEPTCICARCMPWAAVLHARAFPIHAILDLIRTMSYPRTP